MADAIESRPVQFLVTVLAIMAGILLFKAAAAYLPDAGILAALKRVVMAV